MEPATCVRVSSLTFLFWEPMPMPWYRFMAMTMKLSRLTLRPTKIVSFLWIPMTPFASVYQLPFRWRVSWVIRLTLWVCGLTLGILPTFLRKSVSNWTRLDLQRLRFMLLMIWTKILSSISRCKRPRLMSGAWVPS
ncbi:Uncharacterised protein [Streptococcus pneumoniae]|nr:Uncharacterised protein [Streptococcus pneumoniae]